MRNCYVQTENDDLFKFERKKLEIKENEYLNKNRYQPDEKAQWNQFLSEWLAYCLEFGYDPVPVF